MLGAGLTNKKVQILTLLNVGPPLELINIRRRKKEFKINRGVDLK
jgi:hypothetical protein